MADGNGYRLWPKDWRFWLTVITIFITATLAWANLKNDVRAGNTTSTINAERITSVERVLPEINKQLIIIANDVSWMKKNLR